MACCPWTEISKYLGDWRCVYTTSLLSRLRQIAQYWHPNYATLLGSSGKGGFPQCSKYPYVFPSWWLVLDTFCCTMLIIIIRRYHQWLCHRMPNACPILLSVPYHVLRICPSLDKSPVVQSVNAPQWHQPLIIKHLMKVGYDNKASNEIGGW